MLLSSQCLPFPGGAPLKKVVSIGELVEVGGIGLYDQFRADWTWVDLCKAEVDPPNRAGVNALMKRPRSHAQRGQSGSARESIVEETPITLPCRPLCEISTQIEARAFRGTARENFDPYFRRNRPATAGPGYQLLRCEKHGGCFSWNPL